MAPVAPSLPLRFPCWCRAIYSWGGETKRDLGFIEGDLIECLNAGDGSWWMGRLKRDRRMVGLFPSNFVQVLEEGFQPGSRVPSPMPSNGGLSRTASPNPAAMNPSPQKTRSVFRKPFQAYAAAGSPNPEAAARELQSKAGSISSNPNGSLSKRKPYSSMHQKVLRNGSTSPMEPVNNHLPSRAASPNPGYSSRVPSPAPSVQYHRYAANASPEQGQLLQYSHAPSPQRHVSDGSSPPPPPPPPHRVAYTLSRAPSPQLQTDAQHDSEFPSSRTHTPGPRSPGRTNFTPSPLRDAMNEVMSSLQGMEMGRGSPPPERKRSLEIWSPEAFEEVHAAAARKHRPVTSLGIEAPQASYGNEDDLDTYSSRANGPPQVRDYVQRMESRLRKMQGLDRGPSTVFPDDDVGFSHAPSLSGTISRSRPQSPDDMRSLPSRKLSRRLRNRKSAYELGREMIGRTFTTKSISTNASSTAQSTSTQSSNSTQVTSQSLMSGYSAGGFSATSAGSFARRKLARRASFRERPMSAIESRSGPPLRCGDGRPESPSTGVTYHSSHDSRQAVNSQSDWRTNISDTAGVFGGLAAPKPKKSGFLKKMIESAKTGAATARSTISSNQGVKPPLKRNTMLPDGVTAVSSLSVHNGSSAAADMGLGGAIDWVQVRRDVNRSNSLSKNERIERAERCQMLDIPVFNPVDVLYQTAEGDEGLDGLPISDPTDFGSANLGLVDKSTRFIGNLPPMTNSISLAQGYVCRPYRSDVQRLRAIFTWVSERIAWEEDFEGEVDTKRVIQTKRGCSEEIAVLVMEMCGAVGLHAEVVRGYLKGPGEVLDFDMLARPNHWWNAVIVEGEWRIMDCSLAGPTNPRRGSYSSAGAHIAESWWFLARPVEICYTHVPLLPEQQHICPPIPHEILMSLPCACPTFFKSGLQMADFDTSLLNLENLELAHIHFFVPEDIECVAEVEVRTYSRDADGDFFESGDLLTKRGLAQAEWVGGRKRYTVKALLPGDEGQGVLKVYAGKRGLMHSIKSNPHPLAFALPISHTGVNPPYEFLARHPTPHAQRHDLYVIQPQCYRLVVNNTFVFAVRQHPSSAALPSPNLGAGPSRAPSPALIARPVSAMSMASVSASGSAYSDPSSHGSNSSSSGYQKPAKLAIQSPSGKIIRLLRKNEHTMGSSGPACGDVSDGSVWETVIKISERGMWRGLVLADRSVKWVVFAEWSCA